ncbi:Ig-like domain-containing protein [Streptomyces sp. H27-H1]|uniref:L,D-transpeptidase n=1 Tax=Streptomyces sp. H27-H1 TaxID=2996461 RepID=UPI002271B3F3|nr:Ig-like domain-containing protein [Streptomyces sp. H27-H1]MCY0931628.1 Ig-like domain-containing protein [Streptomyces sp. H27-H1]
MKKSSTTTTAVLAAGVCAAVAVGTLVLPGSGGFGGPPTAAGSSSREHAVRISFSPANGATATRPLDGAEVSVSGGRLDSVTLTPQAKGADAVGTLSADGTRWSSGGTLALGTAYTLHAVAQDGSGRGKAVTEDSTFTTLPAANALRAGVVPAASSTVGVGMPVSITFDKRVQDEQAVQRAISVTSSSGRPVVGHWFGPTRLDFRPESFWKPDSKVYVRLALDGVAAAPGAVGVQNTSYDFTVGRSQISTVDASKSMMTVVRDGRALKELPVSTGSPDHATYDGTMVISSKSPEVRMNAATVGLTGPDGKPAYDIPDVPHAMRLSTSGTFLHGNYWTPASVFGETNTSHGCIGLRDVQGGGDPNTPAAWFYANSLVGDVVTVHKAGGGTIKPDNGLSDWNMNWSQWKAGSALA